MAVKERIEVLEQKPEERIKNFDEVSLGFTKEMAIEEAKRCLQCKVPSCVIGCPVQINIPKFIKEISNGEFLKAYETIKESNFLPAICGRVCPQEVQCEGECVLNKIGKPINIGALERFVADFAFENDETVDTEINPILKGKNVAIVGSGPAGLTCAVELAKVGAQVDIYEALHELGGVLVYGIPEFRLPKRIVKKEVNFLKELGVNFVLDTPVGYSISPKELLDSYDAIFLGIGAGTPKFMGIEGSNLNGIYSANEFLTRVNLMRAYKFPEYDTPVHVGKTVAVIGGGNTAMDAARSALRLGAKVYIIYRRSESEMPARRAEIHHAKEEGVEFLLLTNPVRYNGDEKNNLVKIECVKMELGEPDSSGRRRPVAIPGSNFTIDVDVVIEAIGTEANRLLLQKFDGIQLNKYGYIVVNEYGQTSIPKVFAGGDIVTGSATVILAMGAGKVAAKGIIKYITEN